MAWEEYYGDAIDYVIDEYKNRIIKLKHEQWRRKHNEPPTGDVWVCKNGLEIPMHELTEEHIKNAIRYFEEELKDLS